MRRQSIAFYIWLGEVCYYGGRPLAPLPLPQDTILLFLTLLPLPRNSGHLI